ncbi:MAG: lysophospholipid acyltransferase family protein [Alphaproteobacteria bacterium]|nr:lysophospholipid acyltransferase family protein [Alphaproteobacteria bacterium]MBV9693749.1 lysophospholipid acyltransferase family protein [Alphaproteobacteria bacterium]
MRETEGDNSLRLRERLRYAAEALPFFLFMALFKVLGIDAASATGGWIGRNVFYRIQPVVERARENLKAAYPQMGKAERESIILEMCDNLGRTVAEYPHLDKLKLRGTDARLEIAGTEFADAAIAAGKGLMFISGHFANWEAMPVMATELGYEGGLVYRPPNNPYVDRYISRQRASAGPKIQITKSAQGTRKIFTLLRRGLAILMLVDQKTEQGVAAPFFGRDAMTTPAPAALALKLGSALLPASNERLKGARFRMTIHPAIAFVPTGDHEADVLALTAKINAAIEQCVRNRPSQWLWIHRRWTTPRDAVKNLGRT